MRDTFLLPQVEKEKDGSSGGGPERLYVQFLNGLIIILSLLGHKWNQARYR
ncbi:hypothetical protein [Mesorhizobium sp. B4-1-3]|uniref:hypothetical protein n=1 Tax=Mesorhizobium sp. B4-1-3 TaxID=2589889 RepID=UPI0015E2E22F|nr:hypothetical protein [Mesorhizobium sp. B4-1-3]